MTRTDLLRVNETGRGRSDDGDEMKDEPQIMTLGEIADFLKVHRSTLYRLIKQRKLPVFRIGSDYRARRADLMEGDCSRDAGLGIALW